MNPRRPPRFVERLLARILPSGLSREGTLGDLAEEYAQRAEKSRIRAALWYGGQAASLILYRAVSGSGVESSDSDVLMDLRWSLRSLARHPGFSFGIVVILGLGLGSNAAVFSVVDGTLKGTTWWSEPERTVAIWPGREFSFGHLELYQDEQAVFDAVGGYVELGFAVRPPDGEGQSVTGVLITPALFRELAVQPLLGRALTDDDAVFGVERVVVIGEGLWRRSFGGNPDVVGSRLDVSGVPATVVGVMGPSGLAPGGRSELWLPLVMDPRDDDFWKAQSHTLVGVLTGGATLDDAFTDLMNYTHTLSNMFPMFYPDGWAVGEANVARADATQRAMISTPLLLLLGGTALLLLVTALNVGNLLLGRAIERRKELAVRAALGAGRRRLIRQLLAEGVVLTLLALACGLVCAAYAGPWVASLFVEQPVVRTSSIWSPSVLVFSFAAALLAFAVLNGVPIAHFLRSQQKGLEITPDSSGRLQRGLVTAQAAMATFLLVIATLLTSTVGNLRTVPLGYETSDVVAMELSPPQDRVETPSTARDLYDRLTTAAASVPGVEAAGLTGWLPLRAEAPTTPLNLQANPVDPREAEAAPLQMVDPGFFEVMGVRPLTGRLLDSRDRGNEPTAVVVNQALANILWPEGNAVGQLIAIDPHAWDSWVTVVGVIPDLRSGDIASPAGPAVYVSLAENPSRDVTMVVRTSGEALQVSAALREAVHVVEPLVPVREVSDMDDVVRSAYAISWIMMGLLLVLAAIATALGAIGIYGVLAHHVSASKREIGVRMALGAEPSELILSIVRSGVMLAGLGILIGSLGAVLSTRLVESLLFDVSALSPEAYLAPALVLAVIAAVAAWIPAVRAGRLPPATVLRGD